MILYAVPFFFGYVVHVTVGAPVFALVAFVIALYWYIQESRVNVLRIILLVFFGVFIMVLTWGHWLIASDFRYLATCDGERIYQSQMNGWNLRWTTYRGTGIPFVYEEIGTSRSKGEVGSSLDSRFESLNQCLLEAREE